ncbi:hypothetical protein STIUS_v1c05130 [Spiroplasma sp. TIUS-1]|uniref:HAD hydrolase family protein n=1 Tax=Spiroplasma sp. TIUS-1 TaxID=216963 RepID=UPI0013970E68|nr:HAD hydrolase family protein [Spiroplasma sp. TIUS-1]QHX36067.1 hypothetical protein STIUS_v1c05130 [Spiroplasma sp. TIUS-1]
MLKINNNEIKLVVCDVDGTLISKQKPWLSKEMKLAIEELKKRNVYFVIDTGNASCLMDYLTNDYGAANNEYTRYYIGTNGADVRDFIENKSHVVDSFTVEETKKIIDFLTDRKMKFIISSPDSRQSYFIDIDELKESKAERFITRDDLFLIYKPEYMKNKSTSQFTLNNVESHKEDIKDLQKLIGDKMHITWWDEFSIDLIVKGNDKFAGLSHLIKVLNKTNKTNITTDNVIYFGDQHNDLPVFKNIKYSIAMGNAIDEIKELAYEITDNVNENGVPNYLNRLMKIDKI